MITPEQYEKRKKAYLKSKMKAYNKHIAKKQEERNHDENYFLQLVKHSNRSGSHVGCL